MRATVKTKSSGIVAVLEVRGETLSMLYMIAMIRKYMFAKRLNW